MKKYPILKIKSDAESIFDADITLDGKQIPGLRGIKFESHVDNDVNIVTIEILANVEIEAPVEVNMIRKEVN